MDGVEARQAIFEEVLGRTQLSEIEQSGKPGFLSREEVNTLNIRFRRKGRHGKRG